MKTWNSRRRSAWVGAALAVLFVGTQPACNKSPSLLLKITADADVEKADLYVRDDASQQIIFHSGFVPTLAPGEKSKTGARDLTSETLKIAVKLSSGGKYTILIVGVIGDIAGGKPAPTATQLFWGGRYEVHGPTTINARLLTVPAGDDADGDLWPDASDFRAHVPEAAQLYANSADLLDCDDKVNNPVTAAGKTLNISAANINPFAIELCGDGYDEDCNGDGDEPCVDNDKDGDPRGDDCDDNDPARHKPTMADPFPDPPNCCGYSLGMKGTADAGHDYTGDPVLCPKPRCGDGIDEACVGQGPNDPANDTKCFVDADCDGYSPPDDCNDNDPAVHPGAPEICGNGKNDSCTFVNGMSVIDSGCVPCDLDGDGFQRLDVPANCPDSMDAHPGMLDCNDYDSGVYPGASAKAGGSEGGINMMGKLAAALKGLCRTVYSDTASQTDPATAKKIAVSGYTVGDADCNGVAYQACPSSACDADGDGFAKDGSCGDTGIFDCNDNDPTIYPQAPEKCGDGVDQQCQGFDVPCNGQDKDGDGYYGMDDCDDTNPNVHPFALELCNGVDDDCDNDKDEGNPDAAGAALVASGGGSQATCTDSNLGACALGTGLCVCSSSNPKSSINLTNRIACSTDTGSGTVSVGAHCYGAPQPHPQTCTAQLIDDDCNGSYDDLTGANLKEKGQQCGIASAPCKLGTVSGCNRSQTVSPAYGAQATPDDVHLVCTGFVGPTTEICNGIDDDCNGSLTDNGIDERDTDMDKYIVCTTCAGNTLASGLLGCGDCNDGNPAVHPGAPELCNGIDDDCNPATIDGATECGATKMCCALQNGGNTCHNLATETGFCGSCTNACDPLYSNACGGGACECGSTGAACGQGGAPGVAGTYCNGNSCATCNTTAHCGQTCVACGANQVCRSDGSSCTGCNVDGDCSNGSFCKPDGTCSGKIPAGGACTTADPTKTEHSCQGSQYCTDGVCCDKSQSACGVCQSCKVAGNLGTCTNQNNTDLDSECNADLPGCKLDLCNNGSCSASNGAACSTIMCDNSGAISDTTVKECNNGSCNATPTQVMACGDFTCSNGACLTTCAGDADCHNAAKSHCYAGQCYAGKGPGSTCANGTDCNSGACIDSGSGMKVCCGLTARPASCGAADVTCAGSTRTTNTCSAGMGYTTCSQANAACPGGLDCASGTACNTMCNCASAGACTANECINGDYCPSDNSTSCSVCNTIAFCGTNCQPCNPSCTNGSITGGACTSGACSGATSCGGNFACASTTACNTTCANDTDCLAGFWCKAGMNNTCVARISSNNNCNAMNCAGATCLQCNMGGTGVVCPGNSGTKCP
ncbi:MAG: putative metal-binding motif-containing protein [Polyangia bacterium]